MGIFRHVPPVVLLLLPSSCPPNLPYSSFNSPSVEDGYEIDVVATNLGGPTCLEWFDAETLIVCVIVMEDKFTPSIQSTRRTVLVDGLRSTSRYCSNEHEYLCKQEHGTLTRYSHNGQLNKFRIEPNLFQVFLQKSPNKCSQHSA